MDSFDFVTYTRYIQIAYSWVQGKYLATYEVTLEPSLFHITTLLLEFIDFVIADVSVDLNTYYDCDS